MREDILSHWAWAPRQRHTWWRHGMGKLFTLLALCEGNPPMTGGFPSQRIVMPNFDTFFDISPNRLLNKQSKCRWIEAPEHSCDFTKGNAKKTSASKNIAVEIAVMTLSGANHAVSCPSLDGTWSFDEALVLFQLHPTRLEQALRVL